MPKVSEIAVFLDSKAPCSLKMDLDNVGLLCGFPEKEVHTVLVSLDITSAVIKEAAEAGAELIVSHHPVIFTPMKTVRDDDPTGRRLIALLQNGISAINMHTNLDIVRGGVNTALIEALGAEWEEDLSEVGCICRLPEPMNADAFYPLLSEKLGVSDIRSSRTAGTVQRIALCGGAGGDIVYEAVNKGCDTVLTGEIRHHQWLDGAEYGLNLFEAGHFATENVVVPVLADWLREGFPALDVRISSQRSPHV